MSTLGIWKVLEEYSLLFKSRSYLPYLVSVPGRNLRLVFPKFNLAKKLASFSIFGLHTLYCFCYLVAIALKWNTSQVSHLGILILLFALFIPSAVSGMHYTISFNPEVASAILNAMARFETRIKGKVNRISIIYLYKTLHNPYFANIGRIVSQEKCKTAQRSRVVHENIDSIV